MNNTVLIVTGTFYKDIAKNMVFKAIETLADNDFNHECINVPGAFEVPAVISSLSKEDKYIGFVALGCVIRGETSHYDYICSETARALMDLSLQGVAIGYGILTCENKKQAEKRQFDKGESAAIACVKMIQVIYEASNK